MAIAAGVAFAILAALSLGGQAFAVRKASGGGPSTDILLVVLLINVAIIVPLAILYEPEAVVNIQSIMAFSAAGVVGTLLGRSLFYAGIQRIGASRAEPMKASMPLFATLLAIAILNESVNTQQIFGIVLIVVAIVSLSLERGSDTKYSTQFSILYFLPLFAAIVFAFEPIFAMLGFQQGTGVFTGLSIKTLAAVTVFLFWILTHDGFPTRDRFSKSSQSWAIIAGLASTSFLITYYTGLSLAPVGIVVPIMQTSPLVVVILTAIFLRDEETVTFKVLASSVFVVLGAIFVTLG